MIMAKSILLGLLICACCTQQPASAAEGDIYIVGTLKSYHENRKHNYNENNYGIGIQYGLSEDWRLVLGEYKNSFDNKSKYYGAMWLPFHRNAFNAGLLLVNVNGYDGDSLSKYTPVAVPVVTWEKDRFLVNVVFVPPVQKAGIIAVQVGVSF